MKNYVYCGVLFGLGLLSGVAFGENLSAELATVHAPLPTTSLASSYAFSRNIKLNPFSFGFTGSVGSSRTSSSGGGGSSVTLMVSSELSSGIELLEQSSPTPMPTSLCIAPSTFNNQFYLFYRMVWYW